MRRRDRGSVFVYALAVIAVLTVFVVAAAERLRVEADLQLRRLDLTRAERAADAGLARALASLPAANLNALTNQDEWWNLGQAGNEEFLVGSGSFRIQIIDAGSLVNLNNATEEQLLNLPLSQEQVDSLQDWREEGQTPRPLGAKDEFYNNLAFPYNAALRRLDTVTEVLAIRGFDAATLYEPPAGDRVRALTNASADVQLPLIDLVTVDSTAPNVSNDGTARTNLNTAQVGALVQAGFRQQSAQALIARRGGGFAGLRQALETPGLNDTERQAILNRFTIGTATVQEGRINLNTARREVLVTIPGMTDQAADGILARQGTFAELGELTTVPGVTADLVPVLADAFTVGGSTFVVRIQGTHGRQTRYRESIVRVTNGIPQTVRTEVRPGGLPDSWNWPEEPGVSTRLTEEASS